MTRQVLNRGTIANDGTGDTLRSATLKIQQNFEEIYTKLGDGNVLMPLIDFDSDKIRIQSTLGHDTIITAPNASTNRTVVFPNAAGTLVLDTATQTLTNKTLTTPVIADLDLLESSGASFSTQVRTGSISADVIVRVPGIADSDTFTMNAETQTLTNKTLTSPTISNPTLTGTVDDANGNELLEFTATTAAVNHVKVTNAATGNDPILSAVGDNTNIDLRLSGKGTGGVRIQSPFIFANEEISASGALSLSVPVSFINNSGGVGFTLTLADGNQDGEMKHVVVKSINSGVSHTLTPANFTNGTTITLDSNGDAVSLIWSDGNWILLNNSGATIA